jgi:methionyl-tRNA synthetase
MGKDNIPFHTVIFPSTLIGTKDKYTLLHRLSTTEYLNYEDGKFSKTRGVGVFGDDMFTSGIPTEVIRYYLLINRPEKSDSIFTW